MVRLLTEEPRNFILRRRRKVINGTNPLVWSAFRESSFGVAKLVLLNDSFASYTWTRYACDSGAGVPYLNPLAGINHGQIAEPATAANNWRMNFSSSCVSRSDNSKQAMHLVDETFISNTWQQCANSRRLSDINDNNVLGVTKVENVFQEPQLKQGVEFFETEIKGDRYHRPNGTLPLLMNQKKLTLEDNCGAVGQIHLTIGDNPHHSVILSFASAIGPASGMAIESHHLEVAYGTSPTDLDMIAVSDHPRSYSSLLVVSEKALFPKIGKPNLNFTDLRPYIDTTSWYYFFMKVSEIYHVLGPLTKSPANIGRPTSISLGSLLPCFLVR